MRIQEDLWERLPVAAKRPVKGLWNGITLATSPARVLPDFLIIGTQRGGTTSLYEYLVRHPAIPRALTKEVRFFDVEFDRGLNWYRAHFPSQMYKWTRQRTGQPMVVGEATPDYMFDPRVPPRVSAAVPEVKLIVLLRNPIDRAYSHYWHQVSRGFEQLTFEEAIKRETSRTEKYGEEPRGSWERHHHSYLARGVYVDQLSMWMDLFPKDRFFIEKSERLFAHPAAVVGELFQFLGLPDERGGSFPVLNANSSGKMDPITRQMLADYFRPHNERLHRLLGRDLGWTEPAGVA
jgi:Sulfotransferase domain